MIGCLLAVCFNNIGCRSFRKTPVDDFVVQARELSFQGIDAMKDSKWVEAERLFAEAIEVWPDDERARQHYAQTLMHRHEVEKAIEQMTRAVELSDGEPRLLVQLGEMYLRVGDVEEALEQALANAEAALKVDRKMASAWALKGQVRRRQGNVNDSLACFHRSLSYQPFQPEVQFSIADIYSNANRHQRALSTLESLASNYPPGQKPSLLLVRQGVVLKSMGRFRQASEHLELARAKDPKSLETLYHLSESQLLAGNRLNAEITATQARDISPRDSNIQALLARINNPAVSPQGIPHHEGMQRR